MCLSATARLALTVIAAGLLANAQTPAPSLEWRRVGSTVLDLGLASPAGGRVVRAWYSADGQTLQVQTAAGRAWQTHDGEAWAASDEQPPEPAPVTAAVSPEPQARVVAAGKPGVLYAAGNTVWRSEDGGAHWTDVTTIDGRSILGGRAYDIAVSPSRPDEITVAGERGVWRSVDGGRSWAGLNDNLLNLPATRIVSTPAHNASLSVLLPDDSQAVWEAGERGQWRIGGGPLLAEERALLSRASAVARGGTATAAVRAGDTIYAGYADGRLTQSADRGRTWQDSPAVEGAGRVERLYSDERGPSFALAITDSRGRGRVLRTVNRGAFWDDITSTLPAGRVRGITADRLTGAVYVATETGVYFTYTDTNAAAPATAWMRLREEPAADVSLDAGGNQLYVLLESAGVYAAMAPHRARDPRVVSAGDRILRAASPGALLSIIGARVETATAGERSASVLAASELESQVQLPYDLPGTAVMVALNSAGRRIQIGLPVSSAAPSIFVDKDGTPLLMDADTGLMLDAGSPAHSRTRVQVLVSGLGQVTPPWPTGLAAPLQDPPRVVVPVRVYLDREPLTVRRATLAPGYVGLYLVEFELPAIVNRGPAELYLEAARETSNRVRLWLEP